MTAASKHDGAVAYSRAGDVELGEYDEPAIITKFGEVPKIFADYG